VWFSFRTEVRADAVCIGCLFAWLVQDPAICEFLRRWLRYLRIPATATVLFCIFFFHWLPPLFEVLSIGFLICDAALSPESVFARCFSIKPLAWLGTISYSVYVWQQFFFQQRGPNPWHWLYIPIVVELGAVSYYLIEQPCKQFGYSLSSTRKDKKETRVEVLQEDIAQHG
jgi:peptidoglycan/LPS O-acetylase OafA/YrhL